MSYTEEDLQRLTFYVRDFINLSGPPMGGLAHTAKLFLEVPTINEMHRLHMEIMRALPQWLRFSDKDKPPYEVVDRHTIMIDIGGMTLVLTCKEQFAVSGEPSVAYAEMVWTTLAEFEERQKRRVAR